MANELERVLWYLLGGTRGGPLRIRILRLIRRRPYNTNQIAETLDIDYKTAQHHLEVLQENQVVSKTGDTYGAVFHPTDRMDASWDAFEEIVGQIDDGTDEEAGDDTGDAASGATTPAPTGDAQDDEQGSSRSAGSRGDD